MVNMPKSKKLYVKGESLEYGEDVIIQITKTSFGTWDIYIKNRDVGKFWMIYCTSKNEAIRLHTMILDFYGRVSNSPITA